jgi:RNA polymerase sigma factor (sigma-70 family)
MRFSNFFENEASPMVEAMTTEEAGHALFARAQDGDSAAVGALLEQSRPRLLSYLLYHLQSPRDKQIAEDLLQDAYETALKKLSDFDWRNIPGFQAWLKQIVVYRLLDYYKERYPVNPCSGLPEQADTQQETPSRVLRHVERDHILHAAMNSCLNDRERLAVHWRYFDRLPAAEVAALMGFTTGHVKNLCTKALKKLRRALGHSSQFFSSSAPRKGNSP